MNKGRGRDVPGRTLDKEPTMRRQAETSLVALLLGLVLLQPRGAEAWEAKAFLGDSPEGSVSDLFPRIEERSARFYAEDYALVLDLEEGFHADIKFGASNLGESHGAGFTRCRWKGKGVKTEKVDAKMERKSWSFKKDPFQLRMKTLSLTGTEKKMHLRVVGKHSTLDLTLVAEVGVWRPGNGRLELADQGFVELILWPRLKVSGTMSDNKTHEVTRFTGTAVLTHSLTTIPPQHQPPRWFYFKSDDATAPFFFQGVQLGEAFGGGFYGWLLWVKDNAVMAQSASLGLSPVDNRRTGDSSLPWGLYFSDELAGLEGVIQADEHRKTEDLLDKLAPLEAAVVGRFVHPVTHFFKARMELRLKDGTRLSGSGTYKVQEIR